MKTYAPAGLHGAMLRDLLAELGCTPAQAAKFLHVTERSIWRWLAEDSAPFAVLAAIWHETPTGRHVTAVDVGNELTIFAGLARCTQAALDQANARLAWLLAINETGAANEPFLTGPVAAGGVKGFEQVTHDGHGHFLPPRDGKQDVAMQSLTERPLGWPLQK